MRKIIVIICVIVLLVIIVANYIQNIENKHVKQMQVEKEEMVTARIAKMKETINYSYLIKYAKETLRPYFDTISIIEVWDFSDFGNQTRIEKVGFDNSKDESYAVVYVTGEVVGKAKTVSKSPYRYSFTDTIFESQINFQTIKPHNMEIRDDDGFVICPLEDLASFKKRKAEKEKKEKIEKLESANYSVDGIEVRFLRKSDIGGVTGLFYDSDEKLSSTQMKKVAKKIKIEFDFVEFSKNRVSYAYYDREGDYVSYDLR